MEELKRKAINEIIDSSIKSFSDGFEMRHIKEVNDPNGVINAKKNNIFMAELGEEFMFYSAFVRSFDSSFGNVLENIGNSIAKLSYEVKGRIESYLLPQQTQHIDYLMTVYNDHITPKKEDYENFTWVKPRDITSYITSHETDNYFYNPERKEHYIIELKAGGDLDNKKAKAEKVELLREYFLLKNKIEGSNEKIKLLFATAYNKFGEGNEWKQSQVRQYFDEKELLIGQDYWNFVCDDEKGFEIVFDQYKNSSKYIKDAIKNIKALYFYKEKVMKEKRIKESYIVKPALQIIKDNPGINMTELIEELQKVVELYPGDKEILNNRNDIKFSQTVRNLVSHKGNNRFGKCIQKRKEKRNAGFVINELGEKEIQGYKSKEIREELQDNELQRKIRESNVYQNKNDIDKANSRIPEKTSKSNNARYKTDPRLSKTALQENNYICEIEKLTGSKHKTFNTNKNVQYMEGHHLIPMKAQKNFKENIDRTDNICCLCPNCHRAIHYGTIKEKKSRLSILYNEKIEKLKESGIYIDFEELMNKYYL